MNAHKQNAFTLIEVVVALTILGWVLGSVLYMVSQYADERIMMRERFYGNQVAWNQLMENYQKSRGWTPITVSTNIEVDGQEQQGGQSWVWHLDIASAMGRDLFRYESIARAADAEDAAESHLVMYLVGEGGQP